MKLSFPISLIFFSCFLFFSCKKDDSVALPEIEEQEVVLNKDITIYNSNSFYEGYTLIAPLSSNNIYLINMEGFVVKKWESENRGIANYLTEEGNLVRSYIVPNHTFSFAGTTGGIEIFNFEGRKIWNWEYSTSEYSMHHDIEILPNGNILASVWDRKTSEEAIRNGRDPNLLFNREVWPDRIIEVKPLGNNNAEIIWQWSIWDHLIQDFDNLKENFGIVSEHPELADINYSNGEANFNHVNSLSYIEEFNQIVFSSRRFNEFFIIDHSTSTQEAASHTGGQYNKGGDFLYRWGNPKAYKTGTDENQKLFGQHDVTYIANKPNNSGNFLVFNNEKFEHLSSVDEVKISQQADGMYNLQPNVNNNPLHVAWSYVNTEINSPILSGANRLQNGNTLITSGTKGLLIEIDSESNVVWEYTLPSEDKRIFKSSRYSIDQPPFNGERLPILNESI